MHRPELMPAEMTQSSSSDLYPSQPGILPCSADPERNDAIIQPRVASSCDSATPSELALKCSSLLYGPGLGLPHGSMGMCGQHEPIQGSKNMFEMGGKAIGVTPLFW